MDLTSSTKVVLLALVLHAPFCQSNSFSDFNSFPSEYEEAYNKYKEFGTSGGRDNVTDYLPSVFAPELSDYNRLTDQIDYVISRFRNYRLPVNNEQYYQHRHESEDPCEGKPLL